MSEAGKLRGRLIDCFWIPAGPETGAPYVHPLGQRPVVSASITRSCERITRPMNGASGRQ